MNENYAYIKESYTDIDRTLMQSFMLSKKEIKESNGQAIILQRKRINPHLSWHFSTQYLNEDYSCIREFYYNPDGEIVSVFEYPNNREKEEV